MIKIQLSVDVKLLYYHYRTDSSYYFLSLDLKLLYYHYRTDSSYYFLSLDLKLLYITINYRTDLDLPLSYSSSNYFPSLDLKLLYITKIVVQILGIVFHTPPLFPPAHLFIL